MPLTQLMAILSVVRLYSYIFEETCTLLDSPFHAELNGFVQTLNIKVYMHVSYDGMYSYIIIYKFNRCRNACKLVLLLPSSFVI